MAAVLNLGRSHGVSPGEKWKLLGRSPRIRSILEDLERVLPRLEPGRRVPTILLQGETGTGKGLLARTIHEASLYEHAMVLVQLGEAQLETCPAEADRRATQGARAGATARRARQ